MLLVPYAGFVQWQTLTRHCEVECVVRGLQMVFLVLACRLFSGKHMEDQGATAVRRTMDVCGDVYNDAVWSIERW